MYYFKIGSKIHNVYVWIRLMQILDIIFFLKFGLKQCNYKKFLFYFRNVEFCFIITFYFWSFQNPIPYNPTLSTFNSYSHSIEYLKVPQRLLPSKGQKISKANYGCLNSPKKNETHYPEWRRYSGYWALFVFGGELRTPKIAFKIY